MPLAPRSIWLGSAAAVACATAAALLVILTGELDSETGARTVGTALAALLCGGAALAGLQLLERRMAAPGAIVLVAAGAAFVLTTVGLWKFGYFWGSVDGVETEIPDDWFKLVPIGFAWSLALLLGATTALLAERPRPAALGAWVVTAAWATAVTGAALFERTSEQWLKLIAVLGVLAVGSFLFAPLSQRAQRLS